VRDLCYAHSFGKPKLCGEAMPIEVAEGLVLGQELFCFVVVLSVAGRHKRTEPPMHGLIYLIGLIVVILFILSFFGLR
jgi:CDP-diglyceride synthetase